MSKRARPAGGIVAGVILIALGALFVLDELEVFRWGTFLGTWWPLILIGIGVWKLSTRKPVPWRSAGALVAIGVLLQLAELHVLRWGIIWPLILVGIGVWLLVRPSLAPLEAARREDAARLDAWGVLGGSELRVTSQEFRGGRATALFGGVDLDLREAVPAEGDVPLSVSAIFGGVEIVVPDGWDVTMHGVPILGAIEDKRGPAPEKGRGGGPSLHVVAFAFAGAVTLKSA